MTYHKPQIIIVDDDVDMRTMLSEFLTSKNFSVKVYGEAQKTLDDLAQGHIKPSEVDLIISDLRMPGMDGMTFVERCKCLYPNVPVMIVTAYGTIESAITAIQKGAFDYLVKPFRLDAITVQIDRALEFRRLFRENQILRKEHQKGYTFAGIIGKSASMQSVFDLIQRVSNSTSNVLIQGESGTGKELVAKAIHEMGPRANKPFVAINVTAIPDTLLESELFGHEKGSFTGATHKKRGLFEEADGGTLFLDEIGDMDLLLQSKLLRAIQEKKIRPVGGNVDVPFNARIIAATHKDLKNSIRENHFREDLYYRLSVIPIVIPPLRHRADDIPILAQHFLEKYNSLNGLKIRGFSQESMARLVSMPWEGNVRELENVIERAVVLCRSTEIGVGDLPQAETSSVEGLIAKINEELPTVEGLEKRYIRFVLDKTGGRKEKASQILGINRRTLYRKEREYGWVTEDKHFEEPNAIENRIAEVRLIDSRPQEFRSAEM